MVKIYNFQLGGETVSLNVDEKEVEFNIFSTSDTETPSEVFEKSLGGALKRFFGDVFEESDKEIFKKLFSEIHEQNYSERELSFEAEFERNFKKIFKEEYRELFKKKFAQQFEKVFEDSFEEVFSEAFKKAFGVELEEFFQVTLFQIDEKAGLYVKKVIDPTYRVYFEGRSAFEEYYGELGENRSGRVKQALMRTYQLKMKESEIERFKEELGLKPEEDAWLAEEKGHVTFEIPARKHFRYLQHTGFETKVSAAAATQELNRENLGNIDPEIVVAVIDTGVDFTNPYLRDFLVEVEVDGETGPGFDAYNNQVITDPPTKEHGTGVAGVITSIITSTLGIERSSHTKIKILNIQAFPNGADSILANAIVFAVDNGARVINCSWGPLYHRLENQNPLLKEAIEYANEQACICVFAAGNQGNPVRGYYPANSKDVITVGSTKRNDKYSEFSNYGEKLDITAPGENILSYTLNHGFKLYRGTSFAAPIVSATIAMLVCNNSDFEIDDVRERLMDKPGGETEAFKVDGTPISRKRLDAKKFLEGGIGS